MFCVQGAFQLKGKQNPTMEKNMIKISAAPDPNQPRLLDNLTARPPFFQAGDDRSLIFTIEGLTANDTVTIELLNITADGPEGTFGELHLGSFDPATQLTTVIFQADPPNASLEHILCHLPGSDDSTGCNAPKNCINILSARVKASSVSDPIYYYYFCVPPMFDWFGNKGNSQSGVVMNQPRSPIEQSYEQAMVAGSR